MTKEFSVACPTCQTTVVWNNENAFRPFCSKRCQLIDLGEWADEEKSIPCETADFSGSPELGEDWAKY